jgi:pyridoxal 5'-phosphate synthase pdxT subunit
LTVPVAPSVGVLALQGDIAEHLRALREAGAHPVPVRRPGELDAVDALVIPGGESTTIWRLATAFELMDPVRKRIAAGMPAFGSCAGMIMLADRLLDGVDGQQTFGGIDMTVRRNAFGRQVDSFERDITLNGVDGPPLRAVFIRAPWVEDIGQGAEALGWETDHPGPGIAGSTGAGRTGADGKIVAVRQGPLLATSFHPELTGDPRIHRLFMDIVSAS